MTERIEGERYGVFTRDGWAGWAIVDNVNGCVMVPEFPGPALYGAKTAAQIVADAMNLRETTRRHHFIQQGEEKARREIDELAKKLGTLDANCDLNSNPVWEIHRPASYTDDRLAGSGNTFTEALRAAASEGGES